MPQTCARSSAQQHKTYPDRQSTRHVKKCPAELYLPRRYNRQAARPRMTSQGEGQQQLRLAPIPCACQHPGGGITSTINSAWPGFKLSEGGRGTPSHGHEPWRSPNIEHPRDVDASILRRASCHNPLAKPWGRRWLRGDDGWKQPLGRCWSGGSLYSLPGFMLHGSRCAWVLLGRLMMINYPLL